MRLIDADAFNDWILSHFAEPQSALVITLQGFIAEQPTAYDIDKVVEELEKVKGLACDGKSCSECEYTSDCLEGEQSEKVAIDKAIEIVKQGGVSDDVCEWKYNIAPSKNVYFLTDCGHRHNGLLSNNRPYCGFCGKKIKVVDR